MLLLLLLLLLFPKATIREVEEEETKLEAERHHRSGGGEDKEKANKLVNAKLPRRAYNAREIEHRKEGHVKNRKRDIEKMRRSAYTAPPECLAKYMRERRNHKGLSSLLEVWKEDPTWGKVIVSERSRLTQMESKNRTFMWKMECQLNTLFPDPEYVKLLVKTKAGKKDECMANPQCPKVRKWDFYKVYQDCNAGLLKSHTSYIRYAKINLVVVLVFVYT